MTNVEVSVDGSRLGVTDGSGIAHGQVDAGDHDAQLSDREFAFPFEFGSADNDDSVEVIVTFTSTTGDTPTITSRSFGPDDSGTGVLTGKVTSLDGAGLADVTTSAGGVSTSSNAVGAFWRQ